MPRQRTLAMIKPEAAPSTELIIKDIKGAFVVMASKLHHLTPRQVMEFYAEHIRKDFFPDLLSQMTSGPITAMVLEGEDAIVGWRHLMGSTNPRQAAEGTIRHRYAFDSPLPRNYVHGSDSPEAAAREIAFFFPRIALIL